MATGKTKMRTMRWDCDRDGCFKVKKQLKLGHFDDCFPDLIGFSDVDGIVEYKHRFLLIEWKPSRKLSTGQRLTYERMSVHPEFSAVVVVGDAETMEVYEYCTFVGGVRSRWVSDDLDGLKRRIKQWGDK